jgi:hypothetical protein
VTPKPLFAVVCEDGDMFVNEDGVPAVFQKYDHAYEVLDAIMCSGWKCPCDGHRIVEYQAKAKLRKGSASTEEK